MGTDVQQFTSDPPKKGKKKSKIRFAHTNDSQKGMGDYYGTGIRAKIGILRSGLYDQLDSKKLKVPPKNLA
jgi:hypothetical protein